MFTLTNSVRESLFNFNSLCQLVVDVIDRSVNCKSENGINVTTGFVWRRDENFAVFRWVNWCRMSVVTANIASEYPQPVWIGNW